jgi:ABC-type glutathione transport system ATPase component
MKLHRATKKDNPQPSRSSGTAAPAGSTSSYSVVCQSVTKRYINNTPFEKTTVLAVDEVSFAVERGELFGIIGPDGAGKTTLFRILTTLLLADSGTVSVEGKDVVHDFRKIRNEVGYMPGRFSLYQDLTVEENLNVFAKVFKTTIEENYHLIEDIYRQLEPFKKRRVCAIVLLLSRRDAFFRSTRPAPSSAGSPIRCCRSGAISLRSSCTTFVPFPEYDRVLPSATHTM